MLSPVFYFNFWTDKNVLSPFVCTKCNRKSTERMKQIRQFGPRCLFCPELKHLSLTGVLKHAGQMPPVKREAPFRHHLQIVSECFICSGRPSIVQRCPPSIGFWPNWPQWNVVLLVAIAPSGGRPLWPFGRQSDMSCWQFETKYTARQLWAPPFVCTKGGGILFANMRQKC